MDKLVEIFPNPLNLTANKNSSYLESKINIKNLTNNYVIFKVFNNNSTIYSAKPSKSYIAPMETKNVHIKRFTKEEIPNKKGKDQFLFIFYSIDKIINNNDEVKEAFDSKLFNKESKQESIITVLISKDESENIYSEPDLNDLVDDDLKEIKKYNNLIENLKKEYNNINQNIVKLENLFEVIKTQRKLKDEKEKAVSISKAKNITISNKIFNNIILISIILLGLIFGANLANKYNKIFNPTERIIKQIIINQSENFIQNKINEINNIKSNIENKFDGDFLTWRFFLVIYLFCLEFII